MVSASLSERAMSLRAATTDCVSASTSSADSDVDETVEAATRSSERSGSAASRLARIAYK